MDEYYITLEVRMKMKADNEVSAQSRALAAVAKVESESVYHVIGADIVCCTKET